MADSFDYNIILNDLGNVCDKGFDGLKSYCQELNNVIGKCMWKEYYDKFKVDFFALQYLPQEFAEYVPLEATDYSVYSDCFWSFSTLVFGNEERHNELRVRCVVEMTLFKEFYLSKEIVQRVVLKQISIADGERLMLSEQAMDMVFQNEVIATCKLQSQPSDWHILALGSVIQRSIMSVYPETTPEVTKIYFFSRFILIEYTVYTLFSRILLQNIAVYAIGQVTPNIKSNCHEYHPWQSDTI
jgi:hypothetical protein